MRAGAAEPALRLDRAVMEGGRTRLEGRVHAWPEDQAIAMELDGRPPVLVRRGGDPIACFSVVLDLDLCREKLAAARLGAGLPAEAPSGDIDHHPLRRDRPRGGDRRIDRVAGRRDHHEIAGPHEFGPVLARIVAPPRRPVRLLVAAETGDSPRERPEIAKMRTAGSSRPAAEIARSRRSTRSTSTGPAPATPATSPGNDRAGIMPRG